MVPIHLCDKAFCKVHLKLEAGQCHVTSLAQLRKCLCFMLIFFIYLLMCLCLPEQTVWTVVLHNTTNAVKVQGSSLERPHVMQFNYSASPDQLHVLVAGSDQCQQEVVYQCRKSRLFNHWGKSCQQHLVLLSQNEEEM